MNEDKIASIDEMKEEALKIANSVPNLRERQQFMIKIRGLAIEFTIIIEMCFNQLISSTGKEMVFDHLKQELHLIKGKRIKKDLPWFKTKSRDMKWLIEKLFEDSGEKLEIDTFEKFSRFEALRDIFAHVPVNWHASNLEFITDEPYKHFFKLDKKWKDVLFAHQEFVSLFQWILDAIIGYNRLVLLKKEILSHVFLEKSQAEIEEEAKKLMEFGENDKA